MSSLGRPAIVFALTCLLLMHPAPALANGAELVAGDSAAYIWALLNSVQSGNAPPTNVYPLSEQEYYSSLLHETPPTAPDFQNRLVLSLSPYYAAFHTPYPPASSFPYKVSYLNDAIPPIFEIGDALDVQDWAHVRAVYDHTPSFDYMNESGSFAFWKTNTLRGSGDFPRESYVSFALPHASLAIGRFKTGIGYGFFGNTFLNGKAPYYDQLQGSLYGRGIKFHYLLGTSHPYLTGSEAAAQSSGGTEPLKVFAYHRLEWQPLPWMVVGLGEMNLIGGKTPDFAFINPGAMWHNTYTPQYSNVMAMFDLSLVPFKGLHLFTEVTMDDYRLPTEGSGSNPNAFAYQAGARYVLPLAGEVKHAVGAEFTHVDPWTYNRWQPYLTMYQRIMKTGPMYMDVPLGYTYGGDLNHYGIYYMAVSQSGLKVEAAAHRLDKGEIDLGLDSEGNPYFDHYSDAPGPTGVVEHRQSIDLSLDCPLSERLVLSVAGSYTWVSNFGHVQGATGSLGLLRAGLQWSF